jgi:hypothetical protein
VAIVPASLLPFKKHWQAVANELPRGSVLVYLPQQERQRRIVRSVASHFRELGKRVTVMDLPFNAPLPRVQQSMANKCQVPLATIATRRKAGIGEA